MTELDFEELDKAVNSLMTNVDTSKRNTAADDPEDTVVTLTPQPTPAADTAPSEADAASVAPPATSAPLAVKRRGQFMDVMHPSSNMKAPGGAAPSRQGVTLQPVNPSTAPEAITHPSSTEPSSAVAIVPAEMESTGVAIVPAGEAPVSSGVQQPSGDSSVPDEPAKSDWPDPIDNALSGTPDQNIPPSQPVTEPSAANNETPVEAEPLTSPFLPDAKVEKRPLGALSETPEPQPVDTPAEHDNTASSGKVSDESVAAGDVPSAASVALPEELTGDVVALESSNTGGVDTSPSAAVEAAPEASGQITQQYTEQPSSTDQTSTAIYDTSTHTQPLATGKKKSSIGKLILWFALLTLLSIFGGAAYFYFTT